MHQNISELSKEKNAQNGLVNIELCESWPNKGIEICSTGYLHYAKSYRPFELFVNDNYKL